MSEEKEKMEQQMDGVVDFTPHIHAVTQSGSDLFKGTGQIQPEVCAVCELVDNSIMAVKGHDDPTVEIIYEGVSSFTTTNQKKRKKEFQKLWVIDNGSGMDKKDVRAFATYHFTTSERIPESELKRKFPYHPGYGHRFVNSHISKFGVGAKNAIFFLASNCTVYTRKAGSPSILRFVMNKGQIEENYGVSEKQYKLDTEVITEEELLASVPEESIIPHTLGDHSRGFTFICLEDLQSNAFLSQEYIDGLADVYHYFVRDVGIDRRNHWTPAVKIFVNHMHEPRVDLSTHETHYEQRCLSSAKKMFFFRGCVVTETGKKCHFEMELRYHPYQNAKETRPQRLRRDNSEAENESLLHEPIFNVFWNGRLTSSTTLDCLPFCSKFDGRGALRNIKYRSEEFVYARLSGSIFLDNNWEINQIKTTIYPFKELLMDPNCTVVISHLFKGKDQIKLSANFKSVKSFANAPLLDFTYFHQWLEKARDDDEDVLLLSPQKQETFVDKQRYFSFLSFSTQKKAKTGKIFVKYREKYTHMYVCGVVTQILVEKNPQELLKKIKGKMCYVLPRNCNALVQFALKPAEVFGSSPLRRLVDMRLLLGSDKNFQLISESDFNKGVNDFLKTIAHRIEIEYPSDHFANGIVGRIENGTNLEVGEPVGPFAIVVYDKTNTVVKKLRGYNVEMKFFGPNGVISSVTNKTPHVKDLPDDLNPNFYFSHIVQHDSGKYKLEFHLTNIHIEGFSLKTELTWMYDAGSPTKLTATVDKTNVQVTSRFCISYTFQDDKNNTIDPERILKYLHSRALELQVDIATVGSVVPAAIRVDGDVLVAEINPEEVAPSRRAVNVSSRFITTKDKVVVVSQKNKLVFLPGEPHTLKLLNEHIDPLENFSRVPPIRVQVIDKLGNTCFPGKKKQAWKFIISTLSRVAVYSFECAAATGEPTSSIEFQDTDTITSPKQVSYFIRLCSPSAPENLRPQELLDNHCLQQQNFRKKITMEVLPHSRAFIVRVFPEGNPQLGKNFSFYDKDPLKLYGLIESKQKLQYQLFNEEGAVVSNGRVVIKLNDKVKLPSNEDCFFEVEFPSQTKDPRTFFFFFELTKLPQIQARVELFGEAGPPAHIQLVPNKEFQRCKKGYFEVKVTDDKEVACRVTEGELKLFICKDNHEIEHEIEERIVESKLIACAIFTEPPGDIKLKATYGSVSTKMGISLNAGRIAQLKLHIDEAFHDFQNKTITVPANTPLCDNLTVTVHDKDGYLVNTSDEKYFVSVKGSSQLQMGGKIEEGLDHGTAKFGEISFPKQSSGTLDFKILKKKRKRVSNITYKVTVLPDERLPATIKIFNEADEEVNISSVVAGSKQLVLHAKAFNASSTLLASDALHDQNLRWVAHRETRSVSLEDKETFQMLTIPLSTKAGRNQITLCLKDTSTGANILDLVHHYMITPATPAMVVLRRPITVMEMSSPGRFFELMKGNLLVMKDQFENETSGAGRVNISAIDTKPETPLEFDTTFFELEHGHGTVGSLKVRSTGRVIPTYFTLVLTPVFEGGRQGKTTEQVITVVNSEEEKRRQEQLQKKNLRLKEKLNEKLAELSSAQELESARKKLEENFRKLPSGLQNISVEEYDLRKKNLIESIQNSQKKAVGIARGPSHSDVLGTLGSLIYVSKGGEQVCRFISHSIGHRLNTLVCKTWEAAMFFKKTNNVVVLPNNEYEPRRSDQTSFVRLSDCVDVSHRFDSKTKKQILYLVRVILLSNQFAFDDFHQYQKYRTRVKAGKCFIRKTGDVIQPGGFFGGRQGEYLKPFRDMRHTLAYEEEGVREKRKAYQDLKKVGNMIERRSEIERELQAFNKDECNATIRRLKEEQRKIQEDLKRMGSHAQ
eukprot:m.103568 g.103568  ORF g.103568 m.103568 type:complete len:1858 (-) comp12618_c0_seq4:327-5900(-)